MIVGFDAQSTQGNPSGLGVYASRLLEALHHESDPEIEFKVFTHPFSRGLKTPERWWWENVQVPLRARNCGADLLHIPGFAPPVRKSCPVVVTVHDLIGVLFPNQRGTASRLYWGQWLPWAVSRADHIIADSMHTLRDIKAILKFPEDRIHVIPPSGHENFRPVHDPDELGAIREVYGIHEHYFLFVGTLEPRKNLERVIEAFSCFLAKSGDFGRYQLVLAGSREFARGDIYRRLLGNHGFQEGAIVSTGYVPEQQLNALYGGARALVFPSLYEGFGMPVLEAMGAGIPVITSKTTSLPEVAGDAALLVDPESTGEITDAMTQVASDDTLCRTLVEKGRIRIREFSWTRTARETIEVYRKAAG